MAEKLRGSLHSQTDTHVTDDDLSVNVRCHYRELLNLIYVDLLVDEARSVTDVFMNS